MKLIATSLTDVSMIEPRVFGDERGFFLESWNAATFAAAGIDATFVQDNHSRSGRGVLRGMHYQTQHTQGKLVRVTAGEVYDVVVDMRESSATFGQWLGVTLSASNYRMLWVPPGFAHGFCVTSDSADFQYKCTDIYHAESEVSLAWDDPTVGIDWALPDGEKPQLSGKDLAGLSWADAPKFA